ncbi:hypothetical protein AXF42_Ash012202 [Apostasia shenzhenica]|uniref:Uncharacterized protein n=1 Tax=Apostasia shenzhenica TaxID=1088818 RepID=A0A2I0B498_9ASPA|nr:hypothetical protein AXF42_Ash012202 [Apostasia shenzhenica]
MYLHISDSTVFAILIQRPIFYVSQAYQETRYLVLGKLVWALTTIVLKLRICFPTYIMIVVTGQLLRQDLHSSEIIEFRQFDIKLYPTDRHLGQGLGEFYYQTLHVGTSSCRAKAHPLNPPRGQCFWHDDSRH